MNLGLRKHGMRHLPASLERTTLYTTQWQGVLAGPKQTLEHWLTEATNGHQWARQRRRKHPSRTEQRSATHLRQLPRNWGWKTAPLKQATGSFDAGCSADRLLYLCQSTSPDFRKTTPRMGRQKRGGWGPGDVEQRRWEGSTRLFRFDGSCWTAAQSWRGRSQIGTSGKAAVAERCRASTCLNKPMKLAPSKIDRLTKEFKKIINWRFRKNVCSAGDTYPLAQKWIRSTWRNDTFFLPDHNELSLIFHRTIIWS